MVWLIYHLSMAPLHFRTNNYLFKVNNRNTGTWCEICLKLTIKTPCSSMFFCWASHYQRGYFFQTNFALRAVNVIYYRKKWKPNNVQVVYGGYWRIFLIPGDSAWCWVVLGNLGLFCDLCYLFDLFFLTIFVPFKGI